MDNNQNRNNNKRPSGQSIGVLVVIMILTLIAVSMMNSAIKRSWAMKSLCRCWKIMKSIRYVSPAIGF